MMWNLALSVVSCSMPSIYYLRSMTGLVVHLALNLLEDGLVYGAFIIRCLEVLLNLAVFACSLYVGFILLPPWRMAEGELAENPAGEFKGCHQLHYWG